MSRFVRVFIGKTTNQVRHVAEMDVPFPGAGRNLVDSSEDLDPVDLGFAEHFEPRDLAGNPCTPSMHIFLRVEKDHADMPRIHDCPCTMDGIKARLRALGPDGIPVKARAWLANILPPADVKAMGLGRGIPISALKAAEALRNRRDPAGGSRMLVLEREAQQQADRMAAARLRARQKKGG